MGFLAPLAAPLIGSIGSSLIGKALSPGMSPQQNAATNLLARTQQQGFNTGQNLLGMGSSAVQSPINYWSNILSGNRGLMTSALGPDLLRIGEGYNAAAKTSANLMPRGGPSTEFLGELPWAQQRDVTSLLQTARPAAATSLFGAGSNLINAGNNSIAASTSAGRDILSAQAQQRAYEAEQGGKIGAGMYDLFQKYGLPELYKKFPILKPPGSA